MCGRHARIGIEAQAKFMFVAPPSDMLTTRLAALVAAAAAGSGPVAEAGAESIVNVL